MLQDQTDPSGAVHGERSRNCTKRYSAKLLMHWAVWRDASRRHTQQTVIACLVLDKESVPGPAHSLRLDASLKVQQLEHMDQNIVFEVSQRKRGLREPEGNGRGSLAAARLVKIFHCSKSGSSPVAKGTLARIWTAVAASDK